MSTTTCSEDVEKTEPGSSQSAQWQDKRQQTQFGKFYSDIRKPFYFSLGFDPENPQVLECTVHRCCAGSGLGNFQDLMGTALTSLI